MPPAKSPPPPNRPGEKTQASDFEALKRKIHTKLVDKLDLTRVGELEGEVLRREIRLVVEHLCDTEDTLLNRGERERLIEEVLDETFGLGPLEFLLKDASISDILINGPTNIYVERRGNRWKRRRRPVPRATTITCCRSWTASSRKSAAEVDEVCPMVDARLTDVKAPG